MKKGYMIAKSEVRKVLEIKRAEQYEYSNPPDLIASLTGKLVNILSNHSPTSKNYLKNSIAGYFPVRSELDCLCVLDNLRHMGFRTALPVVGKRREALTFRNYTSKSDLVLGAYKIPIPHVEEGEVDPNILLVPLLGFNHHCYRLGYGGGFYDITIRELRLKYGTKLLCIGLGFDFQLEEELPVENWDEQLDFVLTPSKLYTHVNSPMLDNYLLDDGI